MATANDHRRFSVKYSAKRNNVTGPRQVIKLTRVRKTWSGEAWGNNRMKSADVYGTTGTYMNWVGSPQ